MMTLSHLYRATRIALALVMLFTAACVGKGPDRYYMLQPMVAPGPGQEYRPFVIAVGPVRFPDYLCARRS